MDLRKTTTVSVMVMVMDLLLQRSEAFVETDTSV